MAVQQRELLIKILGLPVLSNLAAVLFVDNALSGRPAWKDWEIHENSKATKEILKKAQSAKCLNVISQILTAFRGSRITRLRHFEKSARLKENYTKRRKM